MLPGLLLSSSAFYFFPASYRGNQFLFRVARFGWRRVSRMVKPSMPMAACLGLLEACRYFVTGRGGKAQSGRAFPLGFTDIDATRRRFMSFSMRLSVYRFWTESGRFWSERIWNSCSSLIRGYQDISYQTDFRFQAPANDQVSSTISR